MSRTVQLAAALTTANLALDQVDRISSLGKRVLKVPGVSSLATKAKTYYNDYGNTQTAAITMPVRGVRGGYIRTGYTRPSARTTSRTRGGKGRRKYVKKRASKSAVARMRGRSRLPPGKRAIRTLWKRNPKRRNVGAGMSLKQVTNMLIPRVRFIEKGTLGSIDWNGEEQGLHEHQSWKRSTIETLMTKLASPDVMQGGNSVQLATLHNSNTGQVQQYAGTKCRFDSGIHTYTCLNSSNHAVQVQYITWMCRRPTNYTLEDCNRRDHETDNTLSNAISPLNQERKLTGPDSYGGAIWDKNKKYSYVKHYWKQVRVQFATIDVGEIKIFRDTTKGFVFDPAYADMSNEGDLSVVSPPGVKIQFDFLPGITKSHTFIGRSQMVTSVDGTLIGHGSGKISMSYADTVFGRGMPAQVSYMTVKFGSLDTIPEPDAQDPTNTNYQAHFNTDNGTKVGYNDQYVV